MTLTLVYGATLGLFALIGIIVWSREVRREKAQRNAKQAKE